jgi:hypothetical protein
VPPQKAPEKAPEPERKDIPATVTKDATPGEPKPPDQWSEAEIAAALRECVKLLAPIAVEVEPAPPVRQEQCGAPAPVLLRRLGGVEINPPATLNCAMVAKLHTWVEKTLQPAAQEAFGSPIVRLRDASGYTCRKRNGSHANAEKLSEHALANALDVAGFVTASGRTIEVGRHWGPTRRDPKEPAKVAQAPAPVPPQAEPKAPAAAAGTPKAAEPPKAEVAKGRMTPQQRRAAELAKAKALAAEKAAMERQEKERLEKDKLAAAEAARLKAEEQAREAQRAAELQRLGRGKDKRLARAGPKATPVTTDADTAARGRRRPCSCAGCTGAPAAPSAPCSGPRPTRPTASISISTSPRAAAVPFANNAAHGPARPARIECGAPPTKSAPTPGSEHRWKRWTTPRPRRPSAAPSTTASTSRT